VHPHAFRHRFTLRMIQSGVPLASVSQALGHRSLQTTHRYCVRLGSGHAIEEVGSAHQAIDRGRGVALDAQDRFAEAAANDVPGLPAPSWSRCMAPSASEKRNHVKRALGRG
jgi:hypothetical protein